MPTAVSHWKSENIASHEQLCVELADHIYKASLTERKRHLADSEERVDSAAQRWSKILMHGTDNQLWRVIDFNGTITMSVLRDQRPSDAEFCRHFYDLLNPSTCRYFLDFSPSTAP